MQTKPKDLTQDSLVQAIVEIHKLNEAKGPKLFIGPGVVIFHGEDRKKVEKLCTLNT